MCCAFYSFKVSGVFQSIHKLVENGPLRFQTCLFQQRSESQLVTMSRSEKINFIDSPGKAAYFYILA